jgi:hypothetical protein
MDQATSSGGGPLCVLFLLKKLALMSMKFVHPGGSLMSRKIALTGQTISHCSHSMQTSGSM